MNEASVTQIHTVRPGTGHEGPEGKHRYSSTFYLISALDGGGGQRHAPAALPPGKTRYPLYWRLGAPQPVWTGAEYLALTGIRSPDLPARSKSLYRLSYPCILSEMHAKFNRKSDGKRLLSNLRVDGMILKHNAKKWEDMMRTGSKRLRKACNRRFLVGTTIPIPVL
jgi:hypothetical protein